WVEDGAPRGEPADLRAPPQWTDGWQLGIPDLVVALAQPYVLAADGTDVSRVFVLPIPIERMRYGDRSISGGAAHQSGLRARAQQSRQRAARAREFRRRAPAPSRSAASGSVERRGALQRRQHAARGWRLCRNCRPVSPGAATQA